MNRRRWQSSRRGAQARQNSSGYYCANPRLRLLGQGPLHGANHGNRSQIPRSDGIAGKRLQGPVSRRPAGSGERAVCSGEVFFGSYPKPLPYFLPLIEVIVDALRAKAGPADTARVFVDGIDRKKAAELTNALRLRGVSLDMVKGKRDASEPLIRLADMWAGCIRAAFGGRAEESGILNRALRTGYLECTKEKAP